MDGTLGHRAISQLLGKLETFPDVCLLSQTLCHDYFVMVVTQIGDVWRRFCHKRDSFPYILWQLCDAEGSALIDLTREMQRRAADFPCCVDPEFSGVLLQMLPSPVEPENNEHLERIKQVQSFLQDVSVFCPVSTDATEALHGFAQGKLHRFRGCKPTDEVAKEITIWSKITSSYHLLRKVIWSRTGDPQALRRLGSVKNTGKTGWEKLRAAALSANRSEPKIKRLSGSLSCHGAWAFTWWFVTGE